ncbi:hypothetical protein Ppa06_37640 [Planomonospora parontospora subsp. parontospora]|uniref:Uncharacterized protein n=2 Tax=Planomonospora parontospora TaxID=58119 RepID=A0AA37BIZ2_9ACTN|nr:hypothetical protein [Planomonospora parontospora]GGK77640.1 hypothetical protein GCM10010126_41260 [Planomonospora parontospora]GII09966.1 hypothetical protein Ppa06_37640 [Planomonospora parontospora subsp. parontospora]
MPGTIGTPCTVTDLDDASELARRAEDVDRPILVTADAHGPLYLLGDGTVLYRLRAATQAGCGDGLTQR